MTGAAVDGAAPRWRTRAQHRAAVAAGGVDPAPLAGRWIDSDPAGRSLARLEIAVAGDGLAFEAWAAGEPGPIGRATAAVYAASPAGGGALAFVARLALPATELLLAAYGKSGILVVDSYHRFGAGDPRAPFTVRQFFRRG